MGIGRIRKFSFFFDSASASVAYFPLKSFPLDRKVLANPIPLTIPLSSLTSLVGTKLKHGVSSFRNGLRRDYVIDKFLLIHIHEDIAGDFWTMLVNSKPNENKRHESI